VSLLDIVMRFSLSIGGGSSNPGPGIVAVESVEASMR
jgi:hypothetical protein